MKNIKLYIAILLLLSLGIFLTKDYSALTVGGENQEKQLGQVAPETSELDDEYKRGPDQTYLTYPEWFLVHAPQEQADFLNHATATKFPYINHIYQLWQSYGLVYDEIKDVYEFNTGYHVMIMVISISSTVEYGLKEIYEKIVGRLTDTGMNEKMTHEDILYAQFSNDYVDFINHTPWYKFPFKNYLKNLWFDTPIFGDNIVRKIERRYIMTTEFIIKIIYAKLIGFGTASTYDAPLLTTAIVIDKMPDFSDGKLEKLELIKTTSDGRYIVTVPRYAEFTQYGIDLSEQGITISEVAGNSGNILLTTLSESYEQDYRNISQELFSQPLTTQGGMLRKAFLLDIGSLTEFLRKLKNENIKVEHIYDF